MSKYHTELAVDLDEVVFGYLNGLRTHMRANGLTVSDDEPKTFAMDKSGWFPSIEEFKRVHGEAIEDGLYGRLQEIEGASATLRDLHESGYGINVVTSRFLNVGQNGIVLQQTANALDAIDAPYDSICFLADKVRFFADTYIDDGPHNLEALMAKGRHVIAFSWEYNRYIKGIDRGENWAEIREILRDRYGH